MSHPIVNQDLAAFRPEQHRFPKSAESIEANASSSHPLEDCRQTVTEKTFGSKHISATSLQQKSFFAVADVIRKHLGEGGVKIDVAKCGIGFQRSLYSALFAPLLPDEQSASIVGYVLLDTEGQKFRDAGITASEECRSYLVPTLRVGYDVRHLFP